jgi:hypothetical protein
VVQTISLQARACTSAQWPKFRTPPFLFSSHEDRICEQEKYIRIRVRSDKIEFEQHVEVDIY